MKVSIILLAGGVLASLADAAESPRRSCGTARHSLDRNPGFKPPRANGGAMGRTSRPERPAYSSIGMSGSMVTVPRSGGRSDSRLS